MRFNEISKHGYPEMVGRTQHVAENGNQYTFYQDHMQFASFDTSVGMFKPVKSGYAQQNTTYIDLDFTHYDDVAVQR